MQDYYETLQVHPKADLEAIRASYERLRQRYDSSLLEGAADELVELARRRRDEIERAYTVLSDPKRRATFDSDLSAQVAAPATVEAAAAGDDSGLDDDDLIDYRPLPPARRQERPKGFDTQPRIRPAQAAPRRSGRRIERSQRLPTWVLPILIVAVATFAIVLITLVTTVWNAPQQAAGSASGPSALGQPTASAPTPSVDDIANQFEAQITAARQVAQQVPDNANAWIELGNALYDSVVVVRERIDGGDQRFQGVYIERLPRWLEAHDAYAKALAITPANPVVRADMATALCYYGQGVNDQSYIARGLAEADQAISDSPEEGRALLSKGLCLVYSDPPQTAQALEQWQKAIVMPNVEPGVAQQARQLIAEHSR
ncbi:DnaJ domain-containing protein [Oscillochloris sp. ZM17-4]|uniref:J domain-containing protein n=1 Tax=Oscillochloris sp. ZM17-4 TaxID=2866714 RepID=UPI001C7371E0|nr:DnaJ domain-containing protein [Oscillochloris sp. ZM17-4]MBX0327073.1 DnaJ domain-containing protein [Oscillochloris sp. ZM17-4]